MSKILDKLETLEEKKLDNLTSSVKNSNEPLLLSAPKESLEALEKVGLDFKLRKEISYENQKAKITHLSKILGKSFTGETIFELCVKYDLCITQAHNFRGNLDYSEVGKAITTFCESKDIIPNYSSFFVLAPSEYFDDEIDGDLNLECVLFYKEGRNDTKVDHNTTLIKVASWGDKLPFHRVYNNSFFTYSDDDELSSLSFTAINLVIFLFSFFSGLFGIYPLSIFLGLIGVGLVLVNGLKFKDNYLKWSK